MTRELRDYLEDIVREIERLGKFLRGVSDFEAFSNNDLVVYASIRSLEIIGEAVKHLPEDFRQKHPKIQWKLIAGMRDVLIHSYFGVNTKVIWETLQRNIPQLSKSLEDLMSADHD